MPNSSADPKSTIGILHPGEMGAAVGHCLRRLGHRVVWASDARGAGTRARADAADLEDVGTLTALVEASEIVFSIVPPHGAADLAAKVAGRARVFIDANATSPAESLRIRAAVEAAGSTFIDGSIIGAPPSPANPARLFLSGPASSDAAEVLSGGGLQVIPLKGLAAASALKMCYAAWTKGAQALLLASLATSRAHGVESYLVDEWDRSQPSLSSKSTIASTAAARKGWRWAYEMRAISETFREAGMPEQFHQAAAWIFENAPRDENAEPGSQTLNVVIETLIAGSQ